MKPDFITLFDIKCFFKQIGYEWSGKYYSRKFDDFIYAKSVREVFSNSQKTFLLTYQNNEYHVCFAINLNKFLSYREEPEILGSGSNFYPSTNYSLKWQKFLTEKYGNKYVNILNELEKS